MRWTRALSFPLAALLLAGCVATQDGPGAAGASAVVVGPAPRAGNPIFAPLDLPAPTPQRTAAGVPGPGYWQQDCDYTIEAALDAEGRTVSGVAKIVYTNNSPDTLEYLWIHLEQNLFRPDSLGAQTLEQETRFGYRAGTHGGMHIERVRAGGRDLPLRVYDTVARLDLPEPLGPGGETFEFEIAWTFAIPPFGADRMGIDELAQGEVFQIAQWFPAVATYDDVHGWNALPYLGQGEFYTNISDFDVRITVPRSHLVGATGELINTDEVLTPAQAARLEKARTSAETVVIRAAEEVADPASRPAGDGPLMWRFRAENCRTFAWTSSPAFIWDACGLNLGERTVLVQSLYPKEALPLWSRSTQMLREAIEGYSERWCPYPYPSAINVNGIVGGMEYPMIIFCRERTDEKGLYGVTTHEIGHNWFPMLVNTDERRHPWMDEGFDSFINVYSMADRYPGQEPPPGEMDKLAAAMLEPGQQPIETPADQIERLGYLAYWKPAMGLVLLREVVLGPERFDPAFRRYIRAWAFKSPRPADFFRCMEDAAGADLDWFWRGWFLGTGTLDQAVVDAGASEGGDKLRVTFENRGELVMPVLYRVTYEDGSVEERRLPVEAWLRGDRRTAVWPADGRTIRGVRIDPGRLLPDADRSNNTWGRPE